MTSDVKPHIVSHTEIEPKWRVMDAAGKTLGKISTEIATALQGKDKAYYTPHLLSGDFVVVINAARVKVSAKKMEDKIYYWHTQYPGGLRQRNLSRMLELHPTRVIEYSVKGMLPKNKLGRQMLKRLKIYAGATHPHQAQVGGSLSPKKSPKPKKEQAPEKPTSQQESGKTEEA